MGADTWLDGPMNATTKQGDAMNADVIRLNLNGLERERVRASLATPDAIGIAPARALRMIEALIEIPTAQSADGPGVRTIGVSPDLRREIRAALQDGDTAAIRRHLREIENTYERRTAIAR